MKAIVLALVLAAGGDEPSWMRRPTIQRVKKRIPGRNLVPNGGFEKGDAGGPEGWNAFDGVTLKWVAGGPSGKGRCVRVFTDVYESEYKRFQEALREGRAEPGDFTPAPTKGPRYDTVAGTCGISLFSEKIAIKQGAYYLFSIDIKGPMSGMFFPKVFVKGYAEVEGEEREVWRGPCHCRTSEKEWRTFSWKSAKSPTRFNKGIRYLKVRVMCYWPPGTYLVDNVRLWEVKPDGSPVEP